MSAVLPRRRALLLGCGTFADASLAPLRSPRRDVEELNRTLRGSGGPGYDVTAEVDCTSRQAQRAIEGFLAEARVSDSMHILYFSCHGVQDGQGRLYFAFADTERAYLTSTAVPSDWVRDRIHESRSKATVVLVDCCFSGAFIKGMRARSTVATNVEALVQGLPAGSGVAVLTASGEMEVSFEDADSPDASCSYFTEALVTGISTGAADLNRDGRITVDELYDYIYAQVVSGPSPQRPRKLGIVEGDLVIIDVTTSVQASARLLGQPEGQGEGPLTAPPSASKNPWQGTIDNARTWWTRRHSKLPVISAVVSLMALLIVALQWATTASRDSSDSRGPASTTSRRPDVTTTASSPPVASRQTAVVAPSAPPEYPHGDCEPQVLTTCSLTIMKVPAGVLAIDVDISRKTNGSGQWGLTQISTGSVACGTSFLVADPIQSWLCDDIPSGDYRLEVTGGRGGAVSLAVRFGGRQFQLAPPTSTG